MLMNAPQPANAILSAILYFVDEQYRNLNPEILNWRKELNVSKMLRIAAENKLLYYLCKSILEKSPDIASKEVIASIKQCEEDILKAKLTVEFMHSLFVNEGIDFLIIKTYKGLPYKTFDIDFLIREEHYIPAINVLKNRGAIETDGRYLDMLTKLRLGLPGYQVKGLLKMDLYEGLLWWLPTIDEEFMWKKTRLMDVYGVKCPVPSREADLLSLVSSSLFTDRRFTLLDFLYIKSLLRNKLDYPALLEETKKYGWTSEFLKVLSLIQATKHIIYCNNNLPKTIKFPFVLPWGILNTALPKVITNKTLKNPPSFPFTLANVLFHCFFGRIYAYTNSF